MKRHVFLLVTLFTMSTVAAQQQPIISPKDSIPSVIERITGKENKGFSAHMISNYILHLLPLLLKMS